MELLQLRYFERVAAHESLTLAAKELHITQPALSNAIIRLEQELGVKLFDRTGRTLQLNAQGVYMLSKVKKILFLVDSITTGSYSSLSEGRISVAFDTHSNALLECIRDFRALNPRTLFRIYSEIRIWESTAISEFDFLLHSSAIKLPYAMQSITVDSLSYYAVVPRQSVYANLPELHIRDLKEEPFCFVQAGPMTLEAAYGLCIESGFAPRIAAVTSNMYEKVSCIQKNIGIGIVAGGNVEPISHFPNLTICPIVEFSHLADIKLSWKTRPGLTPICELFLSYAKDYFAIRSKAGSPGPGSGSDPEISEKSDKSS